VRSLIYVAYFFPPTGGAGVQRTLKFARYLPEHSWRPTIVTVKESRYWMVDPTLSSEIPADLEVVRTEARTIPARLGGLARGRRGAAGAACRSGRSQRLLRRLSSIFLIPDPYVGWVPVATRAVRRAWKPGAVLMTTSSPDSAHLVGLRLSRMRIPWIADFRDPWTRRMSFRPPTPLHRRIQHRLEERVVRAASRIIVTSEATARDFRERIAGIDPAKVVCIPNGWDGDDFPREVPPPDPSFLLLHMGQLNPERGVSPLLDHLEAFFRLRPDARARTRVELVGPRYSEDEREARRRGFSDLVRFADPVAHREGIKRLHEAQLLLLMEQDSDEGRLILPGKVPEYLRSGRPILALVPEGGAAWDLIRTSGAGACAPPSDPERGARALADLFAAYLAEGALRARTDPEVVASYDRRRLARRLADILDEVVS